MRNGTVVKDAPTLSIPFQFTPAATQAVIKVVDIIKQKKQGDTVTVSGTVSQKHQTTPERVRDGKLVDSTGIINISVWQDQTKLSKPRDHKRQFMV